MIKKLNSAKLPAGLVDDNVEFFMTSDRVLAMYRGAATPVDQLPVLIIKRIAEQLEADKAASNALNQLQIFDYMQRIETFIACRFGGFDSEPDQVGSTLSKGEYWDCGLRGKCKHEGKLCSPPAKLTAREIEVIKLISTGAQDKQIADKLKISIRTLPVHKRNIQYKTNTKGKLDLLRYAYKHNLYA